MALFGGSRDIDLFRKLNKELINELIDVVVDIYKVDLSTTKEDVYGESTQKVYKDPVRVACLITGDDQAWGSDEFGSDVNQAATFAFLRDTLKDTANIVLEVGDLIKWNANFWEIDGIAENQFVVGKNPDTDSNGTLFGGNHSIVCSTHLSRRTKLSINRTNVGTPNDLYHQ